MAGADAIEELVVRPRSGSDGSLVLSSSRTFVPPSSLTDLLQSTPDVALVGQGGHLQTFAVRGLSKERVRILYHDAPVRALRRAGVSAAFLNPTWMTVATDARTAATAQGSGALGGLVLAAPQLRLPDRVHLGYAGPGRQRSVSLSVTRGRLGAALGYAATDDQQAPDGTRLNTSFEQHSALLTHQLDAGALNGSTTILYGEGRDIGKSNRDFPSRVTSYPLDRHLFVHQELATAELGHLSAWLHGQRLETKTLREGVRTDVETSVLDYGLRYQREAVGTAVTSLTWGLDLFGRADYEVEEDGLTTLDDGRELEIGAYLNGHRQLGRWSLGAGARLLHGQAGADSRDDFDTTELLGKVEVGWRQGQRFGWQLALHRAATLPTVSQLFFTGTTGRGSVLGNGQLDAEDAWTFELSASGRNGNLSYSIASFFMDIDSFIEKVPLSEDVDTFVNADGGKIYGFTGELAYSLPGVILEAGFSTLRGELDDGQAIRDLPASRAMLRGRFDTAMGAVGMEIEQRFESDRVAAGNRTEDARTLVNASMTRGFGERWEVTVFGRNLLDELYYLSGDDKAALGAERTLGIRLVANL